MNPNINPILTSGLTRRSFLKTSTLAASATLAGALDIGRSAHAAESNIIKLGVIGCGGRGTGAVSDALSADPQTQLWAATDVFPDKVEASVRSLAAKFGDRVQVDPSRRFSGLEGYRGVIENCDYVLIACASRFHPYYALAAAQARKPVFVEKPAGVDVVGVQQLLTAADLSEKNGTGILGGVTYRYHLGRREAIQRLRQGEIGDIVAIQCDFLRAPYCTIPRNPQWTELEYQFRNWYHFSWLSGDDVPQSLVHNLDSALWALGDEPPLQAYGLGGRSTHFETELGTSFDHHSVIFEYADGRCIYAACRTAQGCFGSNKDIIHGTKGRCIFKSFSPPQFLDLKGNVTWTADAELSKQSPYQHEHVEFLRSIREGKPMQTARQMATSTLITVLGQMAVYSGQRITWQEALDSKFAYPPHGEVRMDMAPPVKPGPDGIYPVAVPGKTTIS